MGRGELALVSAVPSPKQLRQALMASKTETRPKGCAAHDRLLEIGLMRGWGGVGSSGRFTRRAGYGV